MRTCIGTVVVSLVGSAFVVGANGCAGGADGSEDIETRTGAVSISPAATASGIQYGVMWTWLNNGRNAVPLIQGSNNACFLNAVWGKFRMPTNAPDEVTVFEDWEHQWRIGGYASGSGTPSGDAFCIRGVTPTAEVFAESGQSVSMGVNPATHTCFLTMIAGGFSTAASYVRLRNTGSDLRLEVSSGGTYKRALAQCVAKPPGPELTVSAPNQEVQLRAVTNVGGIPLVGDATSTSTDQPFFCALTKVEGFLNGPDSRWVGAYIKPLSNGAFAWKLGRGPASTYFNNELSASARCVR